LTREKLSSLSAYDERFYGGELREIFKCKDFDWCRCRLCGHYQYIANLDEQKITRMYTAHTSIKLETRPSSFEDLPTRKRDVIDAVFRKLKASVPSGASLLDYGSGFGLWSDVAASHGFNVTSFEPHGDRNKSNVPIQTSWEHVKSKKFDVIICNQVLEHVVDPRSMVARLAYVSRPGALLYCTVPNAGRHTQSSLEQSWPFDGRKSHILAPFQHLNGFSQKSLHMLLAQFGFKPMLRHNVDISVRGLYWLLAHVTRGVIPLISTTRGTFIFSE